MSPSSTSNSEPEPPRGGWRSWGVWAALTLALLAAAEAALRIPKVVEWLPTRTHLYDTSVAARLDALERVKRTYGDIDVLFVGSSIVRTNIQPLTFDRLVRDRAGLPVISFNAGLSGLWPTAVHLYVEHLWLPAAQPHLVVQGVRYPELAATTHALRGEQVFTGTVEAGWHDASWPARLHSTAASHLRLLQYRGTFVSVLQRYVHGRPGARTAPAHHRAIDSRGYTPRPLTLRERRMRGLLSRDQLPATGDCLAGECGVGFAALTRTIDAVRRADAEYVLVNVPEHGSRWRGPRGQQRYRAYLAALEAFAREQRVMFIDPTNGDPYLFEGDDEYSDTYHMSPAGAARFTALLAHELRRRAGSFAQDGTPGPLRASATR